MPTEHRRLALTTDEAKVRAGLVAFPPPGLRPTSAGIGLEPELFPIIRGADGRPAGRLRLRGGRPPGVLDIIDALVVDNPQLGCREGGPVGPWDYPLANGGRLTFEPGAQVEHSTCVYPSVRNALEDGRGVLAMLREAFGRHGVVLAAAGVDIWHDVDSVAQQLPFGRYTAQAAYYDRRGPSGKIMMRHTASLQINLDLGPEGVWQERWLVANLISPLITASFACSPGEGRVSERAHAWQQLDPSRSGFPPALVDGSSDDPREQWAGAAMSADVMLFRSPDGHWSPGTPGFTFNRWLEEGHSEHGWPTQDDLDYHLTTLFFEVRPRGFLELRAGEQVPDCWRAAQVVLTTAILYEDMTRRTVIDRMAGYRGRLPELWRRAARHGAADPELRELAVAVWHEALHGTERMVREYFGGRELACARRFIDEVTERGRTPSDRLRELHEADPARSLAWAISETDPG